MGNWEHEIMNHMNHKQLLDNKIIPARLFQLPDKVMNHPVINRYMYEDKQFKIIYAGRRSYKSEIAKRHIITEAYHHPNSRYIIAASTHSQTKLIYWDSLVDLIPPYLIKKQSDSELKITLFNNSSIELFSADSPSRIEGGNPVSGCILDEASEYDIKTIFNRNILPLLADLNGWCIILGVPRTTYSNEFRELVQTYSDATKYPEWGIYSWSSEDILSATVIDNFKSLTDVRTYATEYLGQFVDSQSGKAYYNYDKSYHTTVVPFNDTLPICISLDFNVGIMSPVFSQVLNNDYINVYQQITDRETNIFKIAPLIQKELITQLGSEGRAKSHRILFYGDYAGFAQTANSRGSAWEELKQFFSGWNMEVRVKSNPPIDRRVAAVNARLMTADGKRHLSVNPRCEELLKDFEYVCMDDLTKDKAKQIERTHSSDALGYFVHYEFPLRGGAIYNG